MSMVLPATDRVVATDRQAVLCESAPRLINGMSVGQTHRDGVWELPAPLGRRGVRTDVLVFQSGDRRETVTRVCQLAQPARAELSQHFDDGTVIGGENSEDHAARLSWNLRDELSNYGAFLEYVAGDDTVDPVVARDGVHSWTTEVHLARARQRFMLALQAEPPVAAIHRVRDRCIDAVVALGGRLRCELQRKRIAIDVGRVQEVDDACIRWIARQPGRSMAERAGPRQRILAVTRQRTHDTFENRVLGAFLKLASAACSEYLWLQSVRNLPEHPRVARIDAFDRVVRDLLAHPGLCGLPDPASDGQPNHALQFDQYYRAIWDGYQILRAAHKRDELLWQWRHRTFGEIVLLDLLSALDASEWQTLPVSEVAEVGIRVDPKCGHWLHIPRALQRRRCRVNHREVDVELIAPSHWQATVEGDLPIIDAAIKLTSVDGSDRIELPIVVLSGPAEWASVGSGSGDVIIVVPEGGHVAGPLWRAGAAVMTNAIIEWPSDLRLRSQAAQRVFGAAVERLAGNGR